MAKTNIEYADEVSNPLMARPKGDSSVKIGTFCEKPDAEGTCKNCWAETLNLRFGNRLAFDKSNRDKIEWILRDKEADRLFRLNEKKSMSQKFEGLPLVVFCCDTFDIFQPSIPEVLRDIIFNYYDRLTNLILLIQTTYPARMNRYFKERYGAKGLPSHYWIGMSAGNQWWLDNHIGALLAIKSSVRYVIFEPILDEVKLYPNYIPCETIGGVEKQPFINWVIVGGESGTKARVCDVNWIRSIVGQCQSASVPVFVKQLGKTPFVDRQDWSFQNATIDLNLNQTFLRLENRKGGDISEFPEDLKIREFPLITLSE
jgi:protein gp37